MTECVLCDWAWNITGWHDSPVYVYRASGGVPFWWRPDDAEPTPIQLWDSMSETASWCAVIAHWAHEHPDQLAAVLGESFRLSPRFMPTWSYP